MEIIKSVNRLITKKRNKYNSLDYSYLKKVSFEKSSVDSDKFRVTLVLPKINKKYVFGGISTAVKFFSQFADNLKCEKRILISDIPLDSSLSEEYPEFDITELKTDSKNLNGKTILSAIDPEWRKENSLQVRENEIFIFTSWRTKFIFDDLYEFQKDNFVDFKKSIYFIQDYEPGFFNWSSEFMLVDSTYRDKNVIAIFNSQSLKDYFELLGYHFSESYHFSPVLNLSMQTILNNKKNDNMPKRKKNILLYGRPFEDRNCFGLAVNSINLFIEKYRPDNSWNFISLGANHRDIKLSNGFKLISKGKLSLESYSEYLLTSKVGISLMASPHPSYPPLEMATFGLYTVTNSFVCKDLTSFSSKIISVEKSDFENIADAINQAIKKSETNNYAQESMKSYLDTDSQFSEIINTLKKVY
ncbi:rhamnosyltransferase WsaF family glycosyltransferase [Enterococcus sp. LJL120]